MDSPLISWDYSCRSAGRTSLTHSAVWRRTWTHCPDIFPGSDLLRSLLKPSQLSSVDLSQITATSLSVCPSPSGSLGLRYHVKTRERRGSSFSQLGLEPNHRGLTAQSLFFLEESCRVNVKKRRAQICGQIQRFNKIPTELRRQTRTSTTHTKHKRSACSRKPN